MKLLSIGMALPHPDIDNYNPLTAPSYFDYDVLYVDPAAVTGTAAALLEEGRSFEAHDGRPVVNAATTASAVSAAELLRRRLDETQRFLERGGLVIVAARPNATQAGIIGFEGCDRYGWLPAPAGMAWSHPYLRAAEGKTLRIVAEDHAFASFLRDLRRHLAYRAFIDDQQPPVREAGRVLAVGGADAPIAVELRVLAGRVLFIPPFPEDAGNARTELAEKLFDCAAQLVRAATPVEAPHWARGIAVPGLEQLEAELEEVEQAAMDTSARAAVVRERNETLAGHRKLLTADGRAFNDAVRAALDLLGFGRVGAPEDGLAVESDGQVCFVETEGNRDEVVEWPYVRLQRRLEKRLLERSESPRGLVVVNGHRHQPPEDRQQQYTDAMRIACENYRYCLVTGETLLAAVKRALGGASEAELSGIRRRLLSSNGLLETAVAVGEAEPARDSDPIF